MKKDTTYLKIHQDGDWAVMFNWSINEDGLYTERRTACNDPKIYKLYEPKVIRCSVSFENAEQKVLEDLNCSINLFW